MILRLSLLIKPTNRSLCLISHGSKWTSTSLSTSLLQHHSLFSTSSRWLQQEAKKTDSIVEAKETQSISTHHSPVRKAKQAATDASYLMIILAGGAIAAGIFYYLFVELFSRETPSGIYNESSKMCLDNFDVQEALGHPIKVTAESGGRRVFQIKNKMYVEDGHIFMIINYYLTGPKNKGVVIVKAKKNNETKKFEYEHIVVQLDFSHRGQDKIYVLHKEADNLKKRLF